MHQRGLTRRGVAEADAEDFGTDVTFVEMEHGTRTLAADGSSLVSSLGVASLMASTNTSASLSVSASSPSLPSSYNAAAEFSNAEFSNAATEIAASNLSAKGDLWDPAKDLDRAVREMLRDRKPADAAFKVPTLAALLAPYTSPAQRAWISAAAQFLPDSFDVIAALLLLFSFATRFYRLDYPNEVIFDEVHFGGFTNGYMKGQHFFDIHPPLTKILFYYVAYYTGYDGHYDFEKIANAYDDMTYYYLRCLPAFTGSFIPVLAYMTLREFWVNAFAATVCAIFLIFDMCLLIESRIIVTDAVLMFFVASAFFCHSHVRNTRPMTAEWYRWLLACGVMIGCCISTKWTALGTMAVIGLDTLFILLNTFSGKSRQYILRDWGWRFIFLLAVPLCLYFYVWVLHFRYLPKSGEGDSMIPAEVQKRFIGNQYEKRDDIETASLFSAIIKVQINMYVHNKAITQPHGSMSTWWSWPFVVHGMGYWGTTLPKEVWRLSLTLLLHLFLLLPQIFVTVFITLFITSNPFANSSS
eukprot:TRINITY_DN3960_c0_g1_i4.p1 TRINITY_DN3960_c0_g1~~TRINITY_DN3960_c0_g1_i4.p1  ORF type:complete len:526 (+),score=83.53 TRINITY_DN3960_c0_g1_i4:56-1633(+)